MIEGINDVHFCHVFFTQKPLTPPSPGLCVWTHSVLLSSALVVNPFGFGGLQTFSL